MPRGDGSGPQGQGRMTGRGLGPCGGGSRQNNKPADNPQPMGRGAGRGMGRAMGSGQASGGGRGLGQRIATGFNNLRQRARARKTRRVSGRRNTA